MNLAQLSAAKRSHVAARCAGVSPYLSCFVVLNARRLLSAKGAAKKSVAMDDIVHDQGVGSRKTSAK